jgi:hypothetical protein
LTVRPDCAEAHCSYTGAAKVEPAPEIVPAPDGGAVAVFEPAAGLVVPVELLVGLVVELVVELELPHAARPNESTTEPRRAPILFLVTTSPWLDC